MSGLIRLELGTVAHLTLANPPLNLVTRELLLELGAALDDPGGSGTRRRAGGRRDR